MSDVTRKTEIQPIDGTPEKRMFWSIISDYDLKTALCELIDNAVDLWIHAKKRQPLVVDITLDAERGIISVSDNAGGVKREELRLLVAPGGSGNDPTAEVIGIFGVGSKRAGIALGEHVEVRTRYRQQETLGIEITPDWLSSDSWELAAYQTPNIAPGTTKVIISQLRKSFGQSDIDEIITHLGETYEWFLMEGCEITINDVPIKAISFENWAFPPGHEPSSLNIRADFGAEGAVNIALTGGLIRDREPEAENYGVYFYCNHRLIVKELKTRDVGYFVTSEAGVPHPDASLCRVIVRLAGPARLMPWNSSKSGINPGHAAFQKLRPTLIQLVSHFSKLSRRFKMDWDTNVFAHPNGSIDVDSNEVTARGRLVLPPLPRVNKSRVEQLKTRNAVNLREQPWTLGLLESIAAVDVITRQRLETKNRIALVLLDSTFEIALKEFIVHRVDLFPPKHYTDNVIQKLFTNRRNVITEVVGKIPIPAQLLARAAHYYNVRNKLIHERATVDVPDADIENYRLTIEAMLTLLFSLKFPH
jgi:Histidine kinase-, DNA gyrase B-, and HSP90-like ATPase